MSPIIDTQSTYFDRVQHFARLTSPLNLFHSRETLAHSQRLLHQALENDSVEHKEKLIQAYYIVHSSIHPDTGTINNKKPSTPSSCSW